MMLLFTNSGPLLPKDLQLGVSLDAYVQPVGAGFPTSFLPTVLAICSTKCFFIFVDDYLTFLLEFGFAI